MYIGPICYSIHAGLGFRQIVQVSLDMISYGRLVGIADRPQAENRLGHDLEVGLARLLIRNDTVVLRGVKCQPTPYEDSGHRYSPS